MGLFEVLTLLDVYPFMEDNFARLLNDDSIFSSIIYVNPCNRVYSLRYENHMK